MTSPALTPWQHIRTALVTVVLATALFVAAPVPQRVTEKTYRSPVAKAELARWHGFLSSVGWPDTQDEFKLRIIRTTNAIRDVYDVFDTPMRPLRRWTGTNQAWALFAVPDSTPDRPELQIKQHGEWVTVMRRLDPDARFLHEQFTYRRIRGVVGGSSKRILPSYTALGQWAADKAFLQWPDATAVRFRQERSHTTAPHEKPDPKTFYRAVKIYERSPEGHAAPVPAKQQRPEQARTEPADDADGGAP